MMAQIEAQIHKHIYATGKYPAARNTVLQY